MTMAENSQAFAPCTPDGLAAELWSIVCDISNLNRELAAVRARKKHIEETLLPLMQKHDIEHIDGEHPRLSIVDGWSYDLYRHTGYQSPTLEFEKARSSDA